MGPFGLSGFRAESASADDWMALTVTGASAIDIVRLDLLMQPGGGSLAVELNGSPVGTFATNAALPSLAQVTLEDRQATRILLRPVGDGPVALLGWGGEAADPGVLYEVHGTPGATLRVMEAWDRRLVGAQMASLAPDLIILGYGTNEGFDDALDLSLYESLFDRQLTSLREMAPNATLLVLGAFDGARLPTWAERKLGADLNTASEIGSRSALPCSPLALNERAMYGPLSAARDPVLARWHAPPNLARVRDLQAQVARDYGAVYWDGAAAMGGACAIHEFVYSDPPLAYGDHVHLTPAGADLLAARLWDFLMQPYASLVCRRQLGA